RLIAVVLPTHFVVEKNIGRLLLGAGRLPQIGVDANWPRPNGAAPVRLEHHLHPRPGNEHLLDGESLQEMWIVKRVRIDRGSEQDWISPLDFIKHERLAYDARQLAGIASGVAIVVDAVADSNAVETGAEIEKYPLVAPGLRPTSQNSSRHAAWKSVKWKPTIPIGLLVKNIQHRSL